MMKLTNKELKLILTACIGYQTECILEIDEGIMGSKPKIKMISDLDVIINKISKMEKE